MSAKRLFPNFAFIDAPFNLKFYDEKDPNTEVAYMGCRTRVLANEVDPNKAITPGRGNLSFTSINLPRIAIKHGIILNDKEDLKGFFEELEEKLELVKDQLLDRFDLQCSKNLANFPFLLGQGVWIDSEKLDYKDKLRKVLKHRNFIYRFYWFSRSFKSINWKASWRI